MLFRTHFVITLFFILLLIPKVTHKISFVLIALFATFIPDIDLFPFPKNKLLLKVKNLFIRHRGFFHSFTFIFLITLFCVLFFPIISLPLFLGYSLHIIVDSFTVRGIRPFFPFKKTIHGKIRTGGKIEFFLFCFFLFIDVFLLSMFFAKL